MIATQVVKNKFWIVEENGEKIATLQMTDNGNVVLVKKNSEREQFPSIKVLKTKYNIAFNEEKVKKPAVNNEWVVYGFPSQFKPYNSLLDVSKKIPVFTKTEKSKSFYCAGYYLIEFNNCYVSSFCPKLITLSRYNFKGPYKDKLEMKEQLRLVQQSINNKVL